MKISGGNKLVCNLYDENNYIMRKRALKQALDYGIILEKVHKVIQFNQKAWSKEYIYMNTKLRKQAENDFEINLFKLMNNLFLEKQWRM